MTQETYLPPPAVTSRRSRNGVRLAISSAAWSLILILAVNPAAVEASDAAPSTQAWPPARLRSALSALPTGDVERGRGLNQEYFCASCHGDKGVAPTQNWPHLAAQKAAYTTKMMLDYQSRQRNENKGAALMHDIAVMLTPQQIADLAAFYAAQPAPRDDGTPRPLASAAGMSAELLVKKGDPARLLTPCASCHSTRGQGGKLEASALAGQNPLYFTRTLLNFQSGQRHNDAAKGMSAFAKKLTRSEIDALAAYYANLPARH